MAFITRNIDGFKVSWAAVNTGWMINVDGEQTATVWRPFIKMNKEGKLIARVHTTNLKNTAEIQDLVRLVVLEPKGEGEVTFKTKPAAFNAVMIAKAISEPVEKLSNEEHNLGRKYYEQEFEIVTRDRKN